MVRQARINPFGLDWRRFLVAEENGRIVGVGQVKPHKDGTRELASMAVVPDRQRQGIGSAIVRALLEREPGPLHLVCRPEMVGYYARFGFRLLSADELPPYFRRVTGIARVVDPLTRLILRESAILAVMRKP